jgi:3-isopropylmalate/(R)-2-methylmalate dehydratase large subunit
MTVMNGPQTIFDKIWAKHRILENEAGETLLYVDHHFLNETSFICFQQLEKLGRTVRRPKQTFMATDHTVPTRNRRAGIPDQENREAIEYLERYAKQSGMTFLGIDHPRQGIGHIVASELGITLPGIVIAGDDSHTTTNGAMGALSIGIGLSEVTHVLATQALWQAPYKAMRVNFSGRLSAAVDAKDLVLALIGRISAAGAIGHFVEFAGTCIATLSMAQRMTICNMAVEAGARAAIIAPDETTFAYLNGRPYAPKGADWDKAVAEWSVFRTDDGATFDREVEVRAGDVAPTVTWGTSPQDAIAVDAVVPDPRAAANPQERSRAEAALAYMGLVAGTRITDIAIDQVFIGSCTNGRIEDLRAAAAIARRGKAVVPAIVVPGSSAVKQQAESEGLHLVFLEAGFEWREPGCSMCLGMNGDLVAEGNRCASTTNRNFVGRQGRNARTHLMGPAMAAAAALTGRIADVRQFLASE